MAKQKHERVNAEEFVKVWQAASSLDEVANKLGMQRLSVATRGRLYRRKYKVALKEFPRATRAVDWAPVRKLAASLNGGAKKTTANKKGKRK